MKRINIENIFLDEDSESYLKTLEATINHCLTKEELLYEDMVCIANVVQQFKSVYDHYDRPKLLGRIYEAFYDPENVDHEPQSYINVVMTMMVEEG